MPWLVGGGQWHTVGAHTTVRVADTVGVADITLLVEDERCKITEIRAVDVKQMKADRRAVSAAS